MDPRKWAEEVVELGKFQLIWVRWLLIEDAVALFAISGIPEEGSSFWRSGHWRLGVRKAINQLSPGARRIPARVLAIRLMRSRGYDPDKLPIPLYRLRA